jgi:hypothetical protein
VAYLNKKTINMRELFKRAALGVDYNHGFLVACSSAEIFEGRSSLEAVEVETLNNADQAFLQFLVNDVKRMASKSDTKTMTATVTTDLGRMRSYFEDRGLAHFGTLDEFPNSPLVDAAPAG